MTTPDTMLKKMARAAILKANGDTERAREAFNQMMIDADNAGLERELCSVYRNTAIRAVLATHYNELRAEGRIPGLRRSTPIRTTDLDKPVEGSRRPSDWQWDDVTGMTAKAHIRRYLESFLVNGKPIGDCRVEEVDTAVDHREADIRFMRELVAGLAPEAIVKEHRTEEDAARLWAIAHGGSIQNAA